MLKATLTTVTATRPVTVPKTYPALLMQSPCCGPSTLGIPAIRCSESTSWAFFGDDLARITSRSCPGCSFLHAQGCQTPKRQPSVIPFPPGPSLRSTDDHTRTNQQCLPFPDSPPLCQHCGLRKHKSYVDGNDQLHLELAPPCDMASHVGRGIDGQCINKNTCPASKIGQAMSHQGAGHQVEQVVWSWGPQRNLHCCLI